MFAVQVFDRSMQLTFAQWFKLARDTAGVSQKKIADSLGLTVQTVGNWEGGRSAPSLNPDQMFKLCALLGVSLEDMAIAFRGEMEVNSGSLGTKKPPKE